MFCWIESHHCSSFGFQQKAEPIQTIYIIDTVDLSKYFNSIPTVKHAIALPVFIYLSIFTFKERRISRDRFDQWSLNRDKSILFNRWWVAAHGTQQGSVPVSATTLADSRDVVQRLRSVLRFLLGALHGLPPVLSPPTLHHLDHYMLHCLQNFESQVNVMFLQYVSCSISSVLFFRCSYCEKTIFKLGFLKHFI